MSEKKEEKTLVQMLDEDKGFIASRRLLMTLSILLLVTVFGGVTIKEANTFIFKLEFVNPEALGWILCIAVFFCTVRYYAFASPYRKMASSIWKQQLMSEIMNPPFGRQPMKVEGLIKEFYQESVKKYQEAGVPCRVSLPYYKTSLREGRQLEYYVYDGDQDGATQAMLRLGFIDERWGLKEKLLLFFLESKHRLIATFQHREYLDVLFPYLAALAAMLSYFIAPHFINDSTQSVLTSFQLLCHPLYA